MEIDSLGLHPESINRKIRIDNAFFMDAPLMIT